MLEKIECTLVGVSALILHNGKLADPTYGPTQELKKLTKKRNKTEEDLLAVREAEWKAGLYLDGDGQIAIPADNVLALVIQGCRKSKLGKDAEAGVYETQEQYPLQYDGPRDINKLYKTPGFVDYRGVVVMRARVMRARPRFNQWRLPVQIAVNTDVIDVSAVRNALEIAGSVVGLGDYRPRFGRFEIA